VLLQLLRGARLAGFASSAASEMLQTYLATRLPGSFVPNVDMQQLEDCYQSWLAASRDLDNPDAAVHRGADDPAATPGIVECPGCAVVPGHATPDVVPGEHALYNSLHFICSSAVPHGMYARLVLTNNPVHVMLQWLEQPSQMLQKATPVQKISKAMQHQQQHPR
jgi:hypothetical protein